MVTQMTGRGGRASLIGVNIGPRLIDLIHAEGPAMFFPCHLMTRIAPVITAFLTVYGASGRYPYAGFGLASLREPRS
jgi:hypothetical protein